MNKSKLLVILAIILCLLSQSYRVYRFSQKQLTRSSNAR